MPPKKDPPLNVARMTSEDQIAYLFHQYEGFADWRLLVDERLEKGEENFDQLNLKVDGLDTRLRTLAATMETRHHELLVINQQVLIAVQGQRIPGMEVPGMADRTKALEDRATKAEEREATKDAKILKLEQFQFRVLAVLAFLGLALSWTAWKVAPYLTQILALFP